MSSTATAIPRFLNTTEGILSTVGLNNVLIGLMVAGIVGKFSVLVLVAIVNSAAVCLANGLSYYAYIAAYPTINKAVASVFADLAWLIQEAGLPLYSYVILHHVLSGGERIVFFTLFWALILLIVVLKVIMIVFTVGTVFHSPAYPQAVDNHLHLGYYLAIAGVECASAVFLLRKFREMLRSSMSFPLRGIKLYRYLMRSTEIRVATIMFIGIMRTVTTSINMYGRRKGVVIDLDGFIYTLECLFPVVMYIDILASRLVFAHETSTSSSNPILGFREVEGDS